MGLSLKDCEYAIRAIRPRAVTSLISGLGRVQIIVETPPERGGYPLEIVIMPERILKGYCVEKNIREPYLQKYKYAKSG